MNSDNNKKNNKLLNEISMQALNSLENTLNMPALKKEDEVKTSNEKHNIITTFKDMFKYITTKNSNEIFQLVLRLLLIVVFIIVLRLPFELFRDLGFDLLISFGINSTDRFLDIYRSVWDIIYIVIALILFFYLVTKRYYNLVEKK